MNGICLIVGGGDVDIQRLKNIPADFIIAADAGYDHLDRAGRTPDLIMGDFDSLSYIPQGENVIMVPSEKNDTDTMLAVKKALSLGYGGIIIYGGTGGRFDHTVANLQTLYYIAENGGQGYLIGNDCVCTVIKNGGLTLPPRPEGYISVFAQSGQARGVRLKGLKYPLVNATLTCDFPLGVSNEFIGHPVEISVDDGTLLVVLEGGDHDPKEHCYTKK